MVNHNCNYNAQSMPFTHRSLPMTRPFGECIEKITNGSCLVYLLSYHNLSTINTVPYPSKKSEVGLCLLKYAQCLISIDERILSNTSFSKDGHENAIVENPSCYVDPDVLNQFQLDILKLACEVTCKYQSFGRRC